MNALAVPFLLFGVLCVYAGARQLTKMGDERLSQLSRGALSPVDWDRIVGAWLLIGAGLAVIFAALFPPGWAHG